MFDRMDICTAYYMFAMLWHGGQWSDTYKIFGRLDRIGFKPSPLLRDETSLTDNAREIYDSLVAHERNYLRNMEPPEENS